MYAKLEAGIIAQYPYTFAQLQLDNPDVSFPVDLSDEVLAEFGLVRVIVTGAPAHDPLVQTADEVTPVFSVERGRWEQAWLLRNLTSQELQAMVPEFIEPHQGLLAIDSAGLSSAFEAWTNDPARTFSERALINRAPVWRRDDPLLQGAATALGLTSEQLDDLFRLAATF